MNATPTREGFVADLWGGIAAMLVALPSAIAYGVAAYAALGPAYVGYGVRAGLLGAIALGLVAPLFGGAPRLISAPCAPAAAVLAALAGGLVAGARGDGPAAPERVTLLLMLVGLFSGLLQFGYGLVRGGRLIKYIPYPVVSGYLSGVALIIFLGQAPNLLGLGKHESPWHPALWQLPALVVGGTAIVVMLVAPRVTKAVPATILALLGGVAAYFALAGFRPELLQPAGNPFVIGPTTGATSGFFSDLAKRASTLSALQFADVKALLMPAVTLSVLLSMDTLKTCVVVDALTRSRHDSNRTLLAQGAANVASAMIGGMPGAGTMGATLVNLESGGKTRVAGWIEGAGVLVATVALGRLIAWVPLAALAGILIVVAVRMFDWNTFRLLRQRSTVLDFAVIAAVIVVAVSTSLIAAAGVGLGLAMLLFIREQIQGTVIHRKITAAQMSSKQHRLPEERALLQAQGEQTVICELEGSLFFGTTDQLFTDLAADLKRCRYLILDWRRVRSVDYTAAHMLEQFEAMLAERGGYLLFSRMPASLPSGQDVAAYFSHLGVTRPASHVQRFETLDDALRWAEDRILTEAGVKPAGGLAPLELREAELFREFADDGTLEFVAAGVTPRTCAAGEKIFGRGDPGDELFIVRRGIIRVALPLKDGTHHNLAFFGRGSFFGEMVFLDRGTRSADAIATVPTDLFVISRQRFDAVVRAHPLVGVKVFARLSRALALRLRDTDAELQALYAT